MATVPCDPELWTDHRTLQLSAALTIPPMLAAAHMLRLFQWCVANAPDGRLTRIAAAVLALAAGWDGDPLDFAAALTTSGWLDPAGAIAGWDRYIAPVAAARARNQQLLDQVRYRTMEASRLAGIHRRAQHAEHARTSDPPPPPATTGDPAGYTNQDAGGRADSPAILPFPDTRRAGETQRRLDELLHTLPECVGHPDQVAILQQLIEEFPAVAFTHEARRMRAYFRRPPTDWAGALDEWIRRGKRLRCLDNHLRPAEQCRDPLPPAPAPSHDIAAETDALLRAIIPQYSAFPPQDHDVFQYPGDPPRIGLQPPSPELADLFTTHLSRIAAAIDTRWPGADVAILVAPADSSAPFERALP